MRQYILSLTFSNTKELFGGMHRRLMAVAASGNGKAGLGHKNVQKTPLAFAMQQ